MLYWFGIIIAIVTRFPLWKDMHMGTLAIDAAVAIFSCGSDAQSSGEI